MMLLMMMVMVMMMMVPRPMDNQAMMLVVVVVVISTGESPIPLDQNHAEMEYIPRHRSKNGKLEPALNPHCARLRVSCVVHVTPCLDTESVCHCRVQLAVQEASWAQAEMGHVTPLASMDATMISHS